MACRPIKFYSSKRGFALIITVVLVAFLVLIVVGLATFTRVETSVATNAQVLAKARQNALAGLNIAIGQLQRHAGPDNRLTARADITISAPATLNHPHFTGVWLSTNDTNTPDVWLVNGPEAGSAVTPNSLNPANAATATQVFLVDRGTVDTNARRVLVAKTPIDAPAGSIPGLATAETIGHYAFWVGDEGVKTSASLIDPLQDAAKRISYNNQPTLPGGPVGDDWGESEQRDRLNQLMLPRPRLERLFNSLLPDSTDGVAQLPKLVTSSQMDFLSNGPTTAQRRAVFHSVTPLSLGVLADVPNGRLKRDLSDSAGASAVGDAINAYRKFRVVNPGSGMGFVATYVPSTVEPAGAEPTNANIAAFSAGPVLRELGFRFWFSADAAGQVSLNYIVEASLWNPYSTELQLTPPATSPTTKLRISLENIPDVQVSSGGAPQTVSLGTLVSGFELAVDPSLTWAAGEIKVVSGTDGVDFTTTGTSDSVNAGVNLGAGATVTSVTYPDLDDLRVVLRWAVAGATSGYLQIYEPDTEFDGDTDTDTSGWTSYSHGWGFALASSLRPWTDGTDTAPRDPRSTTLSGSFVDTTAWNTDVAANSSRSASNDLDGNTTVVLFDLPRQELVSIGDLRHLTRINNTATNAEYPAVLGNGWGDSINSYFDRYFFSTVPRNHTWNFAGGEPLPNRYVRYYPPANAAAPLLVDFQDPDDAARFLISQGAFNINSTSEDAWRVVLGAKLDGWLSESSAGAQNLNNVFFRLPHGAQQTANAPASGASINDDVAVSTGGRQLLPVQIDNLAKEIVDILRDHGRPFDSIEEFLNYPDPGGGTTRGVISLAIEAAGINAPTLNTDYRHSPAALTQADVIANIAPFISPRSDTFLIRVYGDSRNPVTTDIESRAWGEALVQRVPETVDPADNQITPAQPFGRRFKVISFRWLSSNDI
jgi:hypothetical protein